jgi:hypothetical protein
LVDRTAALRRTRLALAVGLATGLIGLLLAPIATLATLALALVVYGAGGRRSALATAGVLIALALAGVRVDRSDRHPALAGATAADRADHQPRRIR